MSFDPNELVRDDETVSLEMGNSPSVVEPVVLPDAVNQGPEDYPEDSGDMNAPLVSVNFEQAVALTGGTTKELAEKVIEATVLKPRPIEPEKDVPTFIMGIDPSGDSDEIRTVLVARDVNVDVIDHEVVNAQYEDVKLALDVQEKLPNLDTTRDDVKTHTPVENTGVAVGDFILHPDDEVQAEVEDPESVSEESLREEPNEEHVFDFAKEEPVVFTMREDEGDDFVDLDEIDPPEPKAYNAEFGRDPFHEVNKQNVMYRALKYRTGEMYDIAHVLPNREAEGLIMDMAREIKSLTEAGQHEEAALLYLMMKSVSDAADESDQQQYFANDPNRVLKQGVFNEKGQMLRTRFISTNKSSGELKGNAALAKLTRKRGTGIPVQAMLPASCIWLTINPPTRLEIIMFFESYSKNKKEFGRRTSGITFGGYSTEISKELFEFMLSYVTATNVEDMDKSELASWMKESDLSNMIAAFIACLAPDGIPFKRICDGSIKINDEMQPCGNRWDALMDFDKVIVVDNTRLTRWQAKMLSNTKNGSIKTSDLETYAKQRIKLVNDTLTYGDFTFTFQTPYLQQVFDEGFDWISTVNTRYHEALANNVYTEQEKEIKLNTLIRATTMRNFAHFVSRIDIGDGNYVVAREDVRNYLEELSNDEDLVIAFNEAIVKFRSSNLVSVAGIPEFICSKCGRNHNLENDAKADKNTPTLKHIIPLDMVSMFFTVLATKHQSVISVPTMVD